MRLHTPLFPPGPVVGELLEDVMPILRVNFHPDKEADVRLKCFSLLSHLVMNSADTIDSNNKFADFAEIVVRDMILPNCVWHAGRVAAAIRTTAVSCAWALLQSGALTLDKVGLIDWSDNIVARNFPFNYIYILIYLRI